MKLTRKFQGKIVTASSLKWLKTLGISLNTMVGEDAHQIAFEEDWVDKDQQDKFKIAIENIQHHLWVKYEGKWRGSIGNYRSNTPLAGAVTLQFNEDEFGYSEIATDEPEIFKYFKE